LAAAASETAMLSDEEAKKILLAASTLGDDGRRRLSCVDAFSLHAKHGIPLPTIGAICDDENIRLTRCQLGCFE
jgi:hypothetical protein